MGISKKRDMTLRRYSYRADPDTNRRIKRRKLLDNKDDPAASEGKVITRLVLTHLKKNGEDVSK